MVKPVLFPTVASISCTHIRISPKVKLPKNTWKPRTRAMHNRCCTLTNPGSRAPLFRMPPPRGCTPIPPASMERFEVCITAQTVCVLRRPQLVVGSLFTDEASQASRHGCASFVLCIAMPPSSCCPSLPCRQPGCRKGSSSPILRCRGWFRSPLLRTCMMVRRGVTLCAVSWCVSNMPCHVV